MAVTGASPSTIPVQTTTGNIDASFKPNAKTGQTTAVTVNGVKVYVHPAQAKQIEAETAANQNSSQAIQRDLQTQQKGGQVDPQVLKRDQAAVPPAPALLVTTANFQAVFHTTLEANDRAVAEDAARIAGPLKAGQTPVMVEIYNQLPLSQKGAMGVQAMKDNAAAKK